MPKKGDLFASFNEVYSCRNTMIDRHGRPWTYNELAELYRLFMAGTRLHDLVLFMGHSSGGILSKLVEMKLVVSGMTSTKYADYSASRYYYDCDVNFEEKKEETEMNETDVDNIMRTLGASKASKAKVIEDIVLIHGTNANDCSDDEIFQLIAELESQKASFEKIQSKPKKLQDKIAGIDTDIKKLCEFVDARPAT